MIDENAELIQEIFLSELRKMEAELLVVFPHDDFREQLTIQTNYEGLSRVEAILSFRPDNRVASESVNLCLAIFCTDKGAIFSSELAWSGGRTIEEIVVCEMCPDCLDDLHQRVGNLFKRIRLPVLDRMIELFANFVTA